MTIARRHKNITKNIATDEVSGLTSGYPWCEADVEVRRKRNRIPAVG